MSSSEMTDRERELMLKVLAIWLGVSVSSVSITVVRTEVNIVVITNDSTQAGLVSESFKSKTTSTTSDGLVSIYKKEAKLASVKVTAGTSFVLTAPPMQEKLKDQQASHKAAAAEKKEAEKKAAAAEKKEAEKKAAADKALSEKAAADKAANDREAAAKKKLADSNATNEAKLMEKRLAQAAAMSSPKKEKVETAEEKALKEK